MSYNIDRIIPVKLNDVRMKVEDVYELLGELEDELPEVCFLKDLEDRFIERDVNGFIRLTSLNFYGDRSGRAFEDVFLQKIAPKIYGIVEAVVIWEGGDSVSGLLVKNGKVAQCEVRYVLEKPEGW